MKEIKIIKSNDFRINENSEYILQEYANECESIDMPRYNPDWEMYSKLEDLGVMFVLGTYIDCKLVGFATIIVTNIPHYSCLSSTLESIFILNEYRSSGIGIDLLKKVEEFSKSMNVESMLISAPIGGSLDKIAGRHGFNKRAITYHKKLS